MVQKEIKNLWIRRIVGIVIGICVVLVMIITSVEIAAYSDYGFYEKEYEKYNVNDPSGIVNMSMEDLIDTTKQMMAYLRGDREDMVIYSTIDGQEKLVFNTLEQSHMADVRNLFIKGLKVRRIALLIILTGIIGLALAYGLKRTFKSVFINIKRVIFFVWALAAVALAAALVDFTRVFYLFHYIFFDNMNWLMDIKINRLVNILPEGFFVDMAIRIGVIYLLLNIIILVVAFFVKRGKITKISQKKTDGGTYERG